MAPRRTWESFISRMVASVSHPTTARLAAARKVAAYRGYKLNPPSPQPPARTVSRHRDNRADIRDFLATRRAKITPEQVGLPTSGRRRVPGLRREEVAVLAGVSTEWYTRLEKGHIAGVSEDVLDAVARALQLDEDERTYLFDLARAARPTRRTPSRRKDVDVPPPRPVAARLHDDVRGVRRATAAWTSSPPTRWPEPCTRRCSTAPPPTSTAAPTSPATIFLDPASHDFFVDWDGAADRHRRAAARRSRARAPRPGPARARRRAVHAQPRVPHPVGRPRRPHPPRRQSNGFNHPDVGHLELTYQSLDLPIVRPGGARPDHLHRRAGHPSEDRLKLLASWAATLGQTGNRPHRRSDQPQNAEPPHTRRD